MPDEPAGDAKEKSPEAAEEGAAKTEGGEAEAGGGGDAAAGGEDDDFGIIGETPKISAQDFFRKCREKAAQPEVGDSPEEHRHWTDKRTWKVRIWDVRIENLIKDNSMYAFANFIFGGTREEFQVKPGDGNNVIWVAGEEGKEIRTPVVHDVPGDGAAESLDFDESFLWKGSYLDVEKQSLRIELWNWSRFRVNKFDSFHQETLVSYAKGSIRNEVECVKMNRFGKRLVRARILFKLYFQEIFDFKLTFVSWRATGLRTCSQTLDVLANGHDSEVKGGAAAAAAGVAPMAGENLRGSLASVSSVASTLGSCEGQRVEIVTPWKRGWLKCLCPCRSGGAAYWSRAASTVSGCADWRQWNGRYVRFRGTCSELSSQSFEATIYSPEGYRELGLARKPWGSRRCGLPLCKASVPLKGILVHGEANAELVPAPWLYHVEGGHRAKKHDSGLLHGRVTVEKQPRFQQCDDLAGDLDLKKQYLFVHVIKVDRVATPDTRPTTDIDTWVEVTFDGKVQKTRVKQDTSAPYFDEILVFELSLARTAAAGEVSRQSGTGLDEQACEEIEGKGPVHFDLWTTGPLNNDHLGSCEAFLGEILADERGQPQKTTSKLAKDKLKKEEETFEVRFLRGQRQLSFIWGGQDPSQLFFEMWILPDLGKNARLKRVRKDGTLPKALASRFPQMQEQWMNKTSGLCQEGRQFPCTIANQWEVGCDKEIEGCFLPRLVDVLQPPRGLDTCNAICHFVGCIPYVSKKSPIDIAFTPDFFARIRKGEALDHALLHAGLLLGAGHLAFVCLGTTMKREPHAWVATLQTDGTVCFWEPFLGMGPRVLPDRLAQPEMVSGGFVPKSLKRDEAQEQAEADRPKLQRLQSEAVPSADLPYRSVEVVFNNTNCWANVQQRDPRRIFWDLWNPEYWHPFASKTSGLRPCFPGCRFVDRDQDDALAPTIRRQVLQQVQSAVRSKRAARNLDTHWVRDTGLSAFLEAGLKLRAKLDFCVEEEAEGLHQQLQDWEHALVAKTPRRHCLRGAPLHFGFCDPPTVAQEAVELSGLAEAREKSTKFAVAVHLVLLPGEVTSLYVLICSLHRLTDLEVEEQLRHRALMQSRDEGPQLLSPLKKAIRMMRGSLHPTTGLDEVNNETIAEGTEAPAVTVAEHRGLARAAAATGESTGAVDPNEGTGEEAHVSVMEPNRGRTRASAIAVEVGAPVPVAKREEDAEVSAGELPQGSRGSIGAFAPDTEHEEAVGASPSEDRGAAIATHDVDTEDPHEREREDSEQNFAPGSIVPGRTHNDNLDQRGQHLGSDAESLAEEQPVGCLASGVAAVGVGDPHAEAVGTGDPHAESVAAASPEADSGWNLLGGAWNLFGGGGSGGAADDTEEQRERERREAEEQRLWDQQEEEERLEYERWAEEERMQEEEERRLQQAQRDDDERRRLAQERLAQEEEKEKETDKERKERKEGKERKERKERKPKTEKAEREKKEGSSSRRRSRSTPGTGSSTAAASSGREATAPLEATQADRSRDGREQKEKKEKKERKERTEKERKEKKDRKEAKGARDDQGRSGAAAKPPSGTIARE